MIPITAIFDIGKTNKKLLLFDAKGNLVHECNETLPETKDEEGYPCENVLLLREWIYQKWNELIKDKNFQVKYLNFTSYGASFVHLDEYDQVCANLYNYLKPYPVKLLDKFYDEYGDKNSFAALTSSPQMGMLNSGMQLFWLKHEKKELFKKIKASLHLPQYLSFLFTKNKVSEFTSIGCHTNLWDFEEKNYHPWVYKEEIINLLPPIHKEEDVVLYNINGSKISIGSGLHDSSAAIIPYLKKYKDPFLLLSTGTWCIVINPFENSLLSKKDLILDCLNFLRPDGSSIKAARIFFGKEHEFQVKRIASFFNKDVEYYYSITFDERILQSVTDDILVNGDKRKLIPACMEGTGPFFSEQNSMWDLSSFNSFEEAYMQLMLDLTSMLKFSILLSDKNKAKTIFVDGGFSKNPVFMSMLATHFPEKLIIASEISQSTALGAALQLNKNIDDIKWKLINYMPSYFINSFQNYYKTNYSVTTTSL